MKQSIGWEYGPLHLAVLQRSRVGSGGISMFALRAKVEILLRRRYCTVGLVFRQIGEQVYYYVM